MLHGQVALLWRYLCALHSHPCVPEGIVVGERFPTEKDPIQRICRRKNVSARKKLGPMSQFFSFQGVPKGRSKYSDTMAVSAKVQKPVLSVAKVDRELREKVRKNGRATTVIQVIAFVFGGVFMGWCVVVFVSFLDG
jgi:hypothetical protein